MGKTTHFPKWFTDLCAGEYIAAFDTGVCGVEGQRHTLGFRILLAGRKHGIMLPERIGIPLYDRVKAGSKLRH